MADPLLMETTEHSGEIVLAVSNVFSSTGCDHGWAVHAQYDGRNLCDELRVTHDGAEHYFYVEPDAPLEFVVRIVQRQFDHG